MWCFGVVETWYLFKWLEALVKAAFRASSSGTHVDVLGQCVIVVSDGLFYLSFNWHCNQWIILVWNWRSLWAGCACICLCDISVQLFWSVDNTSKLITLTYWEFHFVAIGSMLTFSLSCWLLVTERGLCHAANRFGLFRDLFVSATLIYYATISCASWFCLLFLVIACWR